MNKILIFVFVLFSFLPSFGMEPKPEICMIKGIFNGMKTNHITATFFYICGNNTFRKGMTIKSLECYDARKIGPMICLSGFPLVKGRNNMIDIATSKGHGVVYFYEMPSLHFTPYDSEKTHESKLNKLTKKAQITIDEEGLAYLVPLP